MILLIICLQKVIIVESVNNVIWYARNLFKEVKLQNQNKKNSFIQYSCWCYFLTTIKSLWPSRSSPKSIGYDDRHKFRMDLKNSILKDICNCHLNE
jgi:hypothetical protein